MEASTIVVLGGPAAGKTVFLTALYHHLWQGSDEFKIRAASGVVHSELLAAAEQIRVGNMPPATQALRHLEFELDHFGRTYYLRFLDYPGELFRKVFYDSVVDSDEARELYDASTTADGVIALADPESILDRTWDIDYALTNLLRFYASRGRKQPKFVLAFTKRDRTEKLVGGRVTSFVKNHLPHLAADLGEGMRLQHFCSVINTNGQITFSQADTVTAPLRSVVEAIEVERACERRETYLRRIRWRRAILRGLLAVLALLMIVATFALGVVCRDHARPDSAGTSAKLHDE